MMGLFAHLTIEITNRRAKVNYSDLDSQINTSFNGAMLVTVVCHGL